MIIIIYEDPCLGDSGKIIIRRINRWEFTAESCVIAHARYPFSSSWVPIPNLYKTAGLRNSTRNYISRGIVNKRETSYWIVRVPWQPRRPVPERPSQICTLPFENYWSSTEGCYRHRWRCRRHPHRVAVARRIARNPAAAANSDSRITTTFFFLFYVRTGVLL